MTISEKWSALLHHVLQREESVSPAIAQDALILIGWIAGRWDRILRSEGYEPDHDVRADADRVLDALKAKALDEASAKSWPTHILIRWEQEKPFHAVLGQAMMTDWESLRSISAATQTGPLPAEHHDARMQVWVIAFSTPLRHAWTKVLRMLAPEDYVRIDGVVSAVELAQVHAAASIVVVFGARRDVEGQKNLVDEWISRSRLGDRTALVATFRVADALEAVSRGIGAQSEDGRGA